MFDRHRGKHIIYRFLHGTVQFTKSKLCLINNNKIKKINYCTMRTQENKKRY